MSSFGKKGLRDSRQRLGKESMRGVKAILARIDTIADVMNYSSAHQVTEDNFLELAEPLMGRPLDHLETTLLKSKLVAFNVEEDQPAEHQ